MYVYSEVSQWVLSHPVGETRVLPPTPGNSNSELNYKSSAPLPFPQVFRMICMQSSQAES